MPIYFCIDETISIQRAPCEQGNHELLGQQVFNNAFAKGRTRHAIKQLWALDSARVLEPTRALVP